MPCLLIVGGTALNAAPMGTAAAKTSWEHSPREQLMVAVDWSRIPDALIERCRLGGFENLLLQAIIEGGDAVVADPIEDGVRLTLVFIQEEIVITARWRTESVSGVIPVPPHCDATIEVDILHRASLLLVEIARRRVASAKGEGRPRDSPNQAPAARATPPIPRVAPLTNPWRLLAAAGAVLSGRAVFLPAARANIERLLSHKSALAAGVEVSTIRLRDLWLVESTIAVQLVGTVSMTPTIDFVGGLEAGLAGHFFYLNAQHRGSHLTAHAGLPLTLRHRPSGLGFLASPFVHRAAIEHTLDGRTVYDSGHVGATIAVLITTDEFGN